MNNLLLVLLWVMAVYPDVEWGPSSRDVICGLSKIGSSEEYEVRVKSAGTNGFKIAVPKGLHYDIIAKPSAETSGLVLERSRLGCKDTPPAGRLLFSDLQRMKYKCTMLRGGDDQAIYLEKISLNQFVVRRPSTDVQVVFKYRLFRQREDLTFEAVDLSIPLTIPGESSPR